MEKEKLFELHEQMEALMPDRGIELIVKSAGRRPLWMMRVKAPRIDIMNIFYYELRSDGRFSACFEGYKDLLEDRDSYRGLIYFLTKNLEKTYRRGRYSNKWDLEQKVTFYKDVSLDCSNLDEIRAAIEEIDALIKCYDQRGDEQTTDEYDNKYSADGKMLLYGNNSNIEEFVVKDGTEEIWTSAFERFTQLRKVVLPESLKIIHANAFMHCNRLKDINLNKSLEWIGEDAFNGCPLGVLHVGEDAHFDYADSAFSGCTIGRVMAGEQELMSSKDGDGYDEDDYENMYTIKM